MFIDYSHGKSDVLLDCDFIVNNRYFHGLWKNSREKWRGLHQQAVMCHMKQLAQIFSFPYKYNLEFLIIKMEKFDSWK